MDNIKITQGRDSITLHEGLSCEIIANRVSKFSDKLKINIKFKAIYQFDDELKEYIFYSHYVNKKDLINKISKII